MIIQHKLPTDVLTAAFSMVLSSCQKKGFLHMLYFNPFVQGYLYVCNLQYDCIGCCFFFCFFLFLIRELFEGKVKHVGCTESGLRWRNSYFT